MVIRSKSKTAGFFCHGQIKRKAVLQLIDYQLNMNLRRTGQSLSMTKIRKRFSACIVVSSMFLFLSNRK